MRARVIRSFKDIQANLALRKEGEMLEADDARIAELAKKGFVKPLDEPKPETEAIEEAPVEEAPEEEPKPKARKKKSAKKK